MASHAYIPSHILGEDDLSTLTSFNLYDSTRDEGDHEGVLSRLLLKVRSAVTSHSSAEPCQASSSSSLVSSSKGTLADDRCGVDGGGGGGALGGSDSGSGSSMTEAAITSNVFQARPEQPCYPREAAFAATPQDADRDGYEPPGPSSSSVMPAESISARASLDDTVRGEDGGPIAKTSSNDSDTQSVMTNFSVSNYHSLNRVIAQLRGETIKSEKINTEYWMPDEQCKECFDCNARFKFYRRKHHCRICGQIFCGKCASDIIQGERIGQSGPVRVCKFCYSKLQTQERQNQQDAAATSVYHQHHLDHEAHSEIDPDAIVGLSPVLPVQRPPTTAPKMQIPATSIKSHQVGDYGGENSTTLALEIPTTHSLLPYALVNNSAGHLPSSTAPPPVPPPPPPAAPAAPPPSSSSSTAAAPHAHQQPPAPAASPLPSQHNPPSETDLSLKKLLLATIRKPRSRTNTLTSVSGDPAAIDKSAPGSPIPFRRRLSYNPHLTNGFVVDGGGGTLLPSNEYIFSGYDSEDEDARKWDKSPQNLLNFLGGGGGSNLTLSGIDDSNTARMNGGDLTEDDTLHSPVDPPPASLMTSASKIRRKRAEELWTFEHRSSSVRRRRSLTGAPVSSRAVRQRTHSLMRNAPITTANLPDEPTAVSTPTGPVDAPLAANSSGDGNLQPADPSIFNTSTTMTASNNNTSSVRWPSDEHHHHHHAQLRPPSTRRRHRRVCSAPVNIELNAASLDHMRKILRQLLQEAVERTGNKCLGDQWEDVLMNLLLKVCDNVQPDIRGGDEIDIRHYVKIKKIAGGRPQDSYYVKGVVCSKNVAHKKMVKTIHNPQILILLFPLEWSRAYWEDHKLQSIDRVLAQEKDFLEKLVNRIVALKPSVVLVSSNVERIALDHLLKADIVVAYNVKLSILDAVARCTGASIISTFSQLNTDGLTLGHCGLFETKTLVHDLIPNRRKTFLIFRQCPPDLGATVILRGGDIETLRVVKRILDFMVFVVHNLRLESFLLRDLTKIRHAIQAPPIEPPPAETQPQAPDGSSEATEHNDIADPNTNTNDSQQQQQQQQQQSSSVAIPSEHPSSSSSSNQDNISEITAVEPASAGGDETTEQFRCLQPVHELIRQYESVTLSASSLVVLPPPHLLLRLKETQAKLASRIAQHAPDAFACSSSESIPTKLSSMPGYFRSFDQAMLGDPEYDQLIEEHHHRSRAMEAYIGSDGNDTLSPSFHQHLVVLYMSVSSETGVPCQGPEMRMFEYYRPESDLTLGQYIEDIAMDAHTACGSSMCERTMVEHYRSYGHGTAKINVALEPIQGPPPIMATNNILMWSYCKSCDRNRMVPMSENSWKYSFGKFLELMFYQTEHAPVGNQWCPHGMFRDHVHYFGYKGMAVRFQYEVIDPHEVHVPPMHLYLNPTTQASLKDQALDATRTKITRFFDSIVERNKSFLLDIVQPDRVEACKEHLADMSQRAMGEKKQLLQFLQSVYATSPPSDTLNLNIVRIKLQMSVMQWDTEYAEFVRQYVRPERELRRHLRKMFPTETGFTSMIASLDLRTKRTIESPDLPLLDVGLDGCYDHLSKSPPDHDTQLKHLPMLGESPTTASPWLEEEARLDHLMEHMLRERSGNDHATRKAPVEAAPVSTSATVTADDATSTETSDILDPSVARRLSLELMKDTTPARKSIPGGRHDSVEYNNVSASHVRPYVKRRTHNHQRQQQPHPSNACSGQKQTERKHAKNHKDDGDDEADTVSREEMLRRTQRRKANEQKRLSFPAALSTHAAMLPLLSSNAYKRFADLLPSDQHHHHHTQRLLPAELSSSQSSPPLGAKQQRKGNKDGKRSHLQHQQSYEESDQHHHHHESITNTTGAAGGSHTNKRELALSGYRYGYRGSTERGAAATCRLPHAARPFARQRPLSVEGGAASSGSAVSSSSSSAASGSLHHEGRRTERIVKFVEPSGNSSSSSSHLTSVKASRSVRQRLPSKSSIEVYTTIRELVREESDDEFQPSDSDDQDDDDSASDDGMHHAKQQREDGDEEHSPIFSLLHTDEYDESLGREFLPHHHNLHRLYHSRHRVPMIEETDGQGSNTQVPHLTFDEDDDRAADGNSTTEGKHSTVHQSASSHRHPPQHHNTISDFRTERRSIPGSNHQHTASMSTLEPGNMELSSSGSERNSFLRAITNILAEKGLGNLLPLEYPLSPLEHVFPGSVIVVGEDEPSTIIAYTLSCDDYLSKLKEIRKGSIQADNGGGDEQSIHGGGGGSTSSLHGDHMSEKTSVDGASCSTEPVTGMVIERTLRSKSGTHMKYYFTDGTTKFFCKIFFVEQFDALRRNCGCEDSYIASLASCCKWDSSGGKSGSVFLKTKDDRLLIKQISRYEMDAFLRFAPSYFQYMSEAFFHELPTVLSKNFGLYRIGFKNTATGKSMRMDILVMENLFYERAVKKIFDLKGSMRNRHVQATGRENEVLLDENMVELMYQSPLFLRAHSKELLRGCLHNDTLFLSRLDVMDYSLLVGVDEENRELIVGIVDFIRTFTWDKKLESWVKESGILGGGGKEPTIISPKQYRIRFREAIERYFLTTPDFWTAKLGRRHYHHEEVPATSF